MDRREFVAWSIGLGLEALREARAPRVPPPLVELQLGPLGRELARDLDATLAAVRALGVAAVELPSPYAPFDRAPAMVRAALDRAGLVAPGTLVGTGLLYRGWDRALDAARALGCTRVTCAPPLPEERRDARDWPELLDVYAAAAERAGAAGLAFAVRADAWMVVGTPRAPLDALLASQRAARVRVALDVGAAREAGAGADALLRRLGPRAATLHVRAADAGLLAALRAADAGARWVVVPDGGLAGARAAWEAVGPAR